MNRAIDLIISWLSPANKSSFPLRDEDNDGLVRAVLVCFFLASSCQLQGDEPRVVMLVADTVFHAASIVTQ